MIHEGANGIHALTLLGRNVMQNNGNSMKILLTRMSKAAAECNDVEIQGAMLQAVGILKDVTTAIGAKIVGGEVDVGMANAHEYLNMFGHTVIAYVWLEQMKAAEKMLGEGGELSEDERNFYLGKVVAGEFFFKHELVKIRGQAKLLLSFDTGVLKMENSFF
jgi:butyryl-CoA dehydrogenase